MPDITHAKRHDLGNGMFTALLATATTPKSITSNKGGAVAATTAANAAPGKSTQPPDTGSSTCTLTVNDGVVPDTTLAFKNSMTPVDDALMIVDALLPVTVLAVDASAVICEVSGLANHAAAFAAPWFTVPIVFAPVGKALVIAVTADTVVIVASV